MSVAPQLQGGMTLKILFQRGPLAGKSFSFNKAVVVIGRSEENDLVLTDDLRASRKHAEIRWDGEEMRIFNISKKSPLQVNGHLEEDAALASGALVRLGESEFRVEYQVSGASGGSDEQEEAKTKIVDEPQGSVVVQMPILQPTRPNPVRPSAVPVNPGAMAGVGQGYQAMGPAPGAKRRPKVRGGGSKTNFYVLVAIIALVFVWFMNTSPTPKKELSLRSAEQIEKDIESSKVDLKEFEARREKLDSLQYRRAQENYIRGFRDYKQGNYSRARESFQVVLNLDPDNELAKRYYHLARIKFDELVKFHMLQGNRYREKKNWRMCAASYFNVLTMVANNQDPVFKEAKQYYNECLLAQTGRY